MVRAKPATVMLGPFSTREKAVQVARAVYASGWKGRNPGFVSRSGTFTPGLGENPGKPGVFEGFSRGRYARYQCSQCYKVYQNWKSAANHITRKHAGHAVILDIPLGNSNPRKLTTSMTPRMYQRWLSELTPAQRERLKEQVRERAQMSSFMGRPYSKALAEVALRNPDAKALYRNFHGAEPHTRKVDLPMPKGPLTKIGRLLEVTYAPEPPSRRAGTHYYHKLGDNGRRVLPDKPILATDGKNLYVIPDKSSTSFTERGIIG